MSPADTKPRITRRAAVRELRRGTFFEAQIHEAKQNGNVIEGVVLLGATSKNTNAKGKPRVYTEAAMKSAIERKVYEGVQAYVDHQATEGDGETIAPRGVRELLGVFENARLEGGKIKADLNVSARENWFLEDAKNPALAKRMGFSHDAFVDVVETDTAEEVTNIAEALSVDLVTRPATTMGVFESHRVSAKKAIEAEVGDKVLCDEYGQQVVGEVMKKGPALLIRVGDRLVTKFEDEVPVANVTAPAEANPAGEAKPEPAAAAPANGEDDAMDAKAMERLQKLEVENSRLKLREALVKFPEKAREATLTRLSGKALSDEEITAEVKSLEAMAEAFKQAPGVDPDLAAPRGDDESSGGSSDLAHLFEGFGLGNAERAKSFAGSK